MCDSLNALFWGCVAVATPQFDPSRFTEELASAISMELTTRRSDFVAYEIRALAIDCHPWHGDLELCFMIEEDRAHGWSLADWRFFHFTDPGFTGGSTAFRGLSVTMQEYWQRAVETSNDQAADATTAVMECCAAALLSDSVSEALGGYRLSSDFQLWVADPDDPDQHNYCAAARGDKTSDGR